MTYTAEAFIKSPAFMEIATEDAIEVIAKANGQTIAKTKEAFNMQVPSVVNKAAELVMKAAQHCANEANAGRLW